MSFKHLLYVGHSKCNTNFTNKTDVDLSTEWQAYYLFDEVVSVFTLILLSSTQHVTCPSSLGKK